MNDTIDNSNQPLGQARRRGPLRAGDRVQLTDPKGRMHTIVLQEKGFFNANRGSFRHSEVIGKEEGYVLRTKEGAQYQVLRPLLADYVLSMPRGATVVYPKDAAQIIQWADIYPGARVVEAGLGSGALAMSLLSAIGEHGKLYSFERRPEFAQIAKANVDNWFGGRHNAWQVEIGDLSDRLAHVVEPGSIDRIVLDMLAPWENLEECAKALAPGGVLCCYVATVTQMSRLHEELQATKMFTAPQSWETFIRDWHLAGLAVRPVHKMIGHTGFLMIARKLAPGSQPLTRAKRPANSADGLGGKWDKTEDWSEEEMGQRPISGRKVRRILRSAGTKPEAEVSAEDAENKNTEELFS